MCTRACCSSLAECEVKLLSVCISDDDDGEEEEEEEGDEKASKAPKPLSSSALIKLAEGDEDVVEDLELSDEDWGLWTLVYSPL